MEISESVLNVLIIALIILLVVFNIYIKRRRTMSTSLGMVVSIYGDLLKNQRFIEKFSFNREIKMFKTGGWKRFRGKIDFLPQEIVVALSDAFERLDEVNGRIDTARKFKSNSYMAGIDLDTLKEPLDKGKRMLQQWLTLNAENPKYAPKRRGLFG